MVPLVNCRVGAAARAVSGAGGACAAGLPGGGKGSNRCVLHQSCGIASVNSNGISTAAATTASSPATEAARAPGRIRAPVSVTNTWSNIAGLLPDRVCPARVRLSRHRRLLVSSSALRLPPPNRGRHFSRSVCCSCCLVKPDPLAASSHSKLPLRFSNLKRARAAPLVPRPLPGSSRSGRTSHRYPPLRR